MSSLNNENLNRVVTRHPGKELMTGANSTSNLSRKALGIVNRHGTNLVRGESSLSAQNARTKSKQAAELKKGSGLGKRQSTTTSKIPKPVNRSTRLQNRKLISSGTKSRQPFKIYQEETTKNEGQDLKLSDEVESKSVLSAEEVPVRSDLYPQIEHAPKCDDDLADDTFGYEKDLICVEEWRALHYALPSNPPLRPVSPEAPPMMEPPCSPIFPSSPISGSPVYEAIAFVPFPDSD